MRRDAITVRRHSVRLGLVGGATAVALAGGATAAVAIGNGSSGSSSFGGPSASAAASVAVPPLAGSVVDVQLADMGALMRRRAQGSSSGYGAMMGGSGSMMSGSGYGQMRGGRWRGRMMQVRLSRSTVPAGPVSLRVTDVGAMDHELVVLPLAADARVGHRSLRADGTVDERGSLGEVSNNNGAGAGAGLQPRGTGWTTLQLRPGHYELVCNLPGHYAAGMFAELDVTE